MILLVLDRSHSPVPKTSPRIPWHCLTVSASVTTVMIWSPQKIPDAVKVLLKQEMTALKEVD